MAALGLMLSAAVPPTQGQGNPNPGIIPVNKEYVTLSVKGVQRFFSFTVSSGAFSDETGERACLGELRPGNVFLLSGSPFGPPRNLSFDVPSGSRLFVPIAGGVWDNVYPGPELTVEQFYEAGAAFIASITELHASIDGRLVQDLFSYRVITEPFSYTLPATDNFYDLIGFSEFVAPFACPAGFCVYPAIADQIVLLLTPLSPGAHTINVGGAVGSPPGNLTFESTFNIRVVPRGHYQGCT